MNHLIWPVSLIGILSAAVVFGTDMFFLTVGRPALRLASQSAATEVMGFVHVFGDARMPIWGVLAILSNLLLSVLTRDGHRGLYVLSFAAIFRSAIRTSNLWLVIKLSASGTVSAAIIEKQKEPSTSGSVTRTAFSSSTNRTSIWG